MSLKSLPTTIMNGKFDIFCFFNWILISEMTSSNVVISSISVTNEFIEVFIDVLLFSSLLVEDFLPVCKTAINKILTIQSRASI